MAAIDTNFFLNYECESSEQNTDDIETIFLDGHCTLSKESVNVIERLKKEKEAVEKMIKSRK